MPFIPFGEYKPDLAPVDPGSTSMARNVMPGPNGEYLPFRRPVQFSDQLPNAERCRGTIGVRGLDGSALMYAGTSQVLCLSSGPQWVQKSGGTVVLDVDEQWSFAQYKNTVLAASWQNQLLSSDINGASFTPIISGARRPRARHVSVVNREFVTLGNTTELVDGDRPGRVWWLARGNPTSADPNITTQCSFEDLDAEDGAVQGIIGSEYGTIFCERAIWRMTYEGPPTIFRFDKVVRNKGAICPGSIVGFGRATFFWSNDGPYIFDGAKAEPIGDGKISQTAIAEMGYVNRNWMSAVVFPHHTLVMWAIPTSSPDPTKLYIYNWTTGRWSFAEQTVGRLFGAYSASAVIDEAQYTNFNLDDPPQRDWPLDGAQFIGGQPTLGCFMPPPDSRAYYFNGTPLEATLDTSELSPFDGDRRASVTSVRPLVNGTNSMYVTMLTRDDLGVDPIAGVEAPLNLSGAANVWAQGRFLRARLRIPNGFTHAMGVNAQFIREGSR